MKWDLDINCDLGEGIGNDSEIMPLINSCNIACGGHYGSLQSMKDSVILANEYDVKIGAHPSYPDPKNFGRVMLKMESEKLKSSIIQQVTSLKNIIEGMNLKMHHVKLHGALYNECSNNLETAKIVINALLEIGRDFAIYTPNNSSLHKLALAHYEVIPEVFIDRRYDEMGQLVSRKNKAALITNKDEAWHQLKQIHTENTATTLKGNVISIYGKTFCIHGDSPHCLDLLKFINRQLQNV